MRDWLGRYILNAQGEPEPCEDTLKWGRWLEEHNQDRILRHDTIRGVLVSTVFLGLDHNFSPRGLPVLWETMIFQIDKEAYKKQFPDNVSLKPWPEAPYYQERYTSRAAAISGHQKALKRVQRWDKKIAQLEHMYAKQARTLADASEV